MRLLRHLLPTARRTGAAKTRFTLAPAAFAPLELDYDPLVAQLANQCR
ncbi:hypothetical protein P1X14_03925 [Sphingomonas sp. AOB5]|nr:hypothetical protein [Sphingomonas sp. AOB5]MDF7774384.1 hypothetical protein [Sphingomonas sp. AOB5]